MAAVALVAAALTLAVGAPVATAPPAEAATYHCQHRVVDGVLSWRFDRDSYTTGLDPVRHPVKPQIEYLTAQICNNKYREDRFRVKSETQCLTDPKHSSKHTGATFNSFIRLLDAGTKVNPPAHKIEEDGSPEHVCERHSIPRSDQRWMKGSDRPVLSVTTTQNLKFPYPDPFTLWYTSSGSPRLLLRVSAFDILGVPYWPGY